MTNEQAIDLYKKANPNKTVFKYYEADSNHIIVAAIDQKTFKMGEQTLFGIDKTTGVISDYCANVSNINKLEKMKSHSWTGGTR